MKIKIGRLCSQYAQNFIEQASFCVARCWTMNNTIARERSLVGHLRINENIFKNTRACLFFRFDCAFPIFSFLFAHALQSTYCNVCFSYEIHWMNLVDAQDVVLIALQIYDIIYTLVTPISSTIHKKWISIRLKLH